MNLLKTLTFILLFVLPNFVFSQARNVEEIKTWKFLKGENKDAYKIDFNDASWQQVEIPHD